MKIGRFSCRCPTGAAIAFIVLAVSCDAAPTDVADAPTGDLAETLATALQDEFHAEAIYRGVLNDFGPVLPFYNIIEAEVRHSAAIARLYEKRGWSVPENDWTPDNVEHFASVNEACEVGVVAELANVAVYDALLAGPALPSDVVNVFRSNRAASLERHLPAFERCAGQ